MKFKLLLLALAAAQPAVRRAVQPPDAGVRTSVSTKDMKEPVAVHSENFKIFEKEHRALYLGNVKAKMGTTDLSCDRMIVYYAKESKEQEITRAECLGHVVMLDGDKWARGDRADFDNLTGVLVVTGSPEAKQGNNHVWGKKVTFYKDKDVIEVEDATTLFEKKQQQEADQKAKPEGKKGRTPK